MRKISTPFLTFGIALAVFSAIFSVAHAMPLTTAIAAWMLRKKESAIS
jgi:hypothetical protein